MSDQVTDAERVAHLVDGVWFYDSIPCADGKIQMDFSDAKFLTRLAQEAIIARQNK